MKELNLLRRSLFHHRRGTIPHQSLYSTAAEQQSPAKSRPNQIDDSKTPKWFTLPPFTSTVNGSAIGKAISCSAAAENKSSETTALKWVLRSCPQLPRSLVQKLFRLKQVRRESAQEGDALKVTAKDSMNVGDKILLPGSVNVVATEKKEWHCSEEEVEFIRSIVLYKDPAIIVVNKPPGLPVQGGIGIKRSLDELSATCLRYDSSDPPRLVSWLCKDAGFFDFDSVNQHIFEHSSC
ncbi:RNA pseudouridine synthase 4, mitochondrial [Linum perenne]